MMASLRGTEERGTSSSLHSHAINSENQTMASNFLVDCKQSDQNTWLDKHQLELSMDDNNHEGTFQLKQPKLSVDIYGTSSAVKCGDQGMQTHGGEAVLRPYKSSSGSPLGSLASQEMDIIAIGLALNTNRKPKARRRATIDPQSIYARQRRERVYNRLNTLQHLVPNGDKVDIVTMLDETYDYIKFLQYQVTLLESNEFWMHATPYNYNGMDTSSLP